MIVLRSYPTLPWLHSSGGVDLGLGCRRRTSDSSLNRTAHHGSYETISTRSVATVFRCVFQDDSLPVNPRRSGACHGSRRPAGHQDHVADGLVESDISEAGGCERLYLLVERQEQRSTPEHGAIVRRPITDSNDSAWAKDPPELPIQARYVSRVTDLVYRLHRNHGRVGRIQSVGQFAALKFALTNSAIENRFNRSRLRINMWSEKSRSV